MELSLDHQLILQHTHPTFNQTFYNMSPMHHSNQQASRRTLSSPSSSSSQGSNAWVNSFSQGGVGLTGVRATLLFGSQRAAERLLALTNPCWSLPIGCSLVHRGRIKSTITSHPAKGEDMVMSATTTSLASLIEGIPRHRNRS